MDKEIIFNKRQTLCGAECPPDTYEVEVMSSTGTTIEHLPENGARFVYKPPQEDIEVIVAYRFVETEHSRQRDAWNKEFLEKWMAERFPEKQPLEEIQQLDNPTIPDSMTSLKECFEKALNLEVCECKNCSLPYVGEEDE
jgi:hypothetical protein